MIRGYKPGRFSFNVKGGRCETCKGGGLRVIEMNFLPDVYVECEACQGKRFNRETLEIKYKGKSIYDVLEMTIEDACILFKLIPKIYRKLKTRRQTQLNIFIEVYFAAILWMSFSVFYFVMNIVGLYHTDSDDDGGRKKDFYQLLGTFGIQLRNLFTFWTTTLFTLHHAYYRNDIQYEQDTRIYSKLSSLNLEVIMTHTLPFNYFR